MSRRGDKPPYVGISPDPPVDAREDHGREELPKTTLMAQRALTKELPLRADVLLALCRGCSSIPS